MKRKVMWAGAGLLVLALTGDAQAQGLTRAKGALNGFWGWRMQDKRAVPGTTDDYVHDEEGCPLWRIASTSHDPLCAWLNRWWSSPAVSGRDGPGFGSVVAQPSRRADLDPFLWQGSPLS